ncbi:MAG: hypothetical protein AAF541_11945 [Pseudomonadota bacterium]
MTEPQQTCAHLLLADACKIDVVLDAHLQPADALMACTLCNARYLIELIDISDGDWAYRLSCIESAAYEATVRSLDKGSCDIHRAQQEIFSLRHHATDITDQVLIRADGVNVGLPRVSADLPIPQASWRELPCDGRWLASL